MCRRSTSMTGRGTRGRFTPDADSVRERIINEKTGERRPCGFSLARVLPSGGTADRRRPLLELRPDPSTVDEHPALVEDAREQPGISMPGALENDEVDWPLERALESRSESLTALPRQVGKVDK